MGRKTIKMNISSRSIQSAIDELGRYKDDIKRKNEEFVRKLCEIGIPIIDQNISSAKGDSDKSHNTYIKMNSFGDYSKGTLVCEGRDLLFIEFGAGVHYNGSAGSSPHPKGQELGYTIGSYGKGHGKEDYWFYYADSGESVKSHGTEATMPVYKASVEIIQNIRKVAKEVFGG